MAADARAQDAALGEDVKRWVDSSTSLPDAAGLLAAREAGLYGWCGYLASKAGVKLYAPWPKEHFDRVRAAGLRTGAYVSGWDDPVAVAALAADWGIDLLILDVEARIRGDGTWVPGWLSAAGAGLYGASSVHSGRTAVCHVLADYPGGADPQATWPSWLSRPAGPCGWQWHGSTGFYGATVDLAWFDDAIGGTDEMTQAEVDEIKGNLIAVVNALHRGNTPIWDVVTAAMNNSANAVNALSDLKTEVDALKAALSAVQAGTPVAHTHPITANTGDPYK